MKIKIIIKNSSITAAEGGFTAPTANTSAAVDTTIDNAVGAAADAAADAAWQEQHDCGEAIDTIRSLYPPGADCCEAISRDTLYQAVAENNWENLPTSILVRLAELQRDEDDRQVNASLNRYR